MLARQTMLMLNASIPVDMVFLIDDFALKE